MKETLDDVKHRRLSYDSVHGSPRSASKEVCAVKEVRLYQLVVMFASAQDRLRPPQVPLLHLGASRVLH